MAVPPPPGPSFGDRSETVQMYTPWELKKEDGTDRTPDERIQAFREWVERMMIKSTQWTKERAKKFIAEVITPNNFESVHALLEALNP